MAKDVGDDLGDRMKMYEACETSRRSLPTLPIYSRIDGRGFSRFTKGMNRPYDTRMTQAMVETTKYLVAETHASCGYVQSDEISLVWHNPRRESNVFFDGKIMKMTSVLASMATVAFMTQIINSDDPEFRAYTKRMPHFDARVIPLPSREEAANMILWRTNDAFKNAVSMAAHHYFSHKSLQGMKQAAMQERLFQEAGINFNDYPIAFKQGTFVQRQVIQRRFTVEELSRIPEKHRPAADLEVSRTVVSEIDMPNFRTVSNRVGVIFDNEAPICYV